jgi:GTP diphosphokinase / guanosine-3',5'-bis(diphosphate) 3'-diphosphatase
MPNVHLLEPLSEQEQDEERKLINSMYRELLRCIKVPMNETDQLLVREAFELAAEAHKVQRRKDGTPYITHPIQVARICIEEIGLGPTGIACALLHDVVEDTEITLEEIRQRFPDSKFPDKYSKEPDPNKKVIKEPKGGKIRSRVATIVEGLTKLDSLHEYQYPQAENIRRVLESMLTDVRVVLIKMADRLHNMRTIGAMTPEKQLKIAAETDSIYTPLAHQLGLYKIKTEFQDNFLKITNRPAYQSLKDKLAETKEIREAYIARFIQPIKTQLAEYGLEAEVFGRPKSIHSIHEKMVKKKVGFEQIYDLFAIRIVLDVEAKQERMACWQAYAIVTDCYKPIPERQKDWISIPKTNGYESLHISVVGPEGRFVEVQIRTNRMDDIAERGFAAHWKYKGVQGFGSQANIFDRWLADLRENLKDKDNPVEFIADFQSAMYVEDAVQIFTPKGDIKILPRGATALDFAFSIHSNVGSSCQVVKVAGVLQPFNYKLQTGDQVEIITSKNQKPTEDWLLYVITSRAKTRIKAALNEEKRLRAADGKEILARKLHNMFKVTVDDNVDQLSKWLNYPNRLEFLCAIALGQFNFSQLKKFKVDGNYLTQPEPAPKQDNETQPNEVGQPTPVKGRSRKKTGLSQAVIINDEPGVYYSYQFANCCAPIPGEAIFAYLNADQTANIHRATCSNAKFLLSNYAYRILKAEWGNVVRDKFETELIITGRDIGRGVIHQVSGCIESLGINMQSFNMSGDEGGLFQGNVILEVSTPEHLNLAISALKSFDYVIDVKEIRLEAP